MRDDRPSWLDMYRHLEAGGTATAYFAAGQPTNVICVHVGRNELSGASTSSIWHDPMFVVSEPNEDWVGTVTISEVGRQLMAGVDVKVLWRRFNLGDGDRNILKGRVVQLSGNTDRIEYARKYKRRRDVQQKIAERNKACKKRLQMEASMQNG